MQLMHIAVKEAESKISTAEFPTNLGNLGNLCCDSRWDNEMEWLVKSYHMVAVTPSAFYLQVDTANTFAQGIQTRSFLTNLVPVYVGEVL